MRTLGAFTIVSLDGFFAGPGGEIDWFRTNDAEDRKFAAENARPGGTLLFGRTTYELMRQYWPTPQAIATDPEVANTMNTAQKIVFSRSLPPQPDGPVWKNTTVLREIHPAKIQELKAEAGGNMVILGSGSIVRQLANLGLIDEFQLLVNPIILGTGKYLFPGVKRTHLRLVESRAFPSGKLFLRYRPVL